jgi:hypothetical protein
LKEKKLIREKRKKKKKEEREKRVTRQPDYR